MNDVWEAIAEICLELHPDRIRAISQKVVGLPGVGEFGNARDRFGPNAGLELFKRLREAWQTSPDVTPAEIVAGLKSASAAAARQGQKGTVELVWSGPVTDQVPVRQTEEVICQVIENAYSTVLIFSFAVYRIERILKCLEAADARGVEINVLLEINQQQGGKIQFDGFSTFHKRLPKARLWRWNPNSEVDPATGAVHAKAVVADESRALVSSANLTEAAMHQNMEMGLLVGGGSVPGQIQSLFRQMREAKTISAWSASG